MRAQLCSTMRAQWRKVKDYAQACPLIVSSNNMLSPPRDRLQHKNMPPERPSRQKSRVATSFFRPFLRFCTRWSTCLTYMARGTSVQNITWLDWLPGAALFRSLNSSQKSHNFQFKSKSARVEWEQKYFSNLWFFEQTRQTSEALEVTLAARRLQTIFAFSLSLLFAGQFSFGLYPLTVCATKHCIQHCSWCL